MHKLISELARLYLADGQQDTDGQPVTPEVLARQVSGGPAVTASGFVFPFVPVGLNSVCWWVSVSCFTNWRDGLIRTSLRRRPIRI